jgi:hypothetical protein
LLLASCFFLGFRFFLLPSCFSVAELLFPPGEFDSLFDGEAVEESSPLVEPDGLLEGGESAVGSARGGLPVPVAGEFPDGEPVGVIGADVPGPHHAPNQIVYSKGSIRPSVRLD